jgi:hypothetical protein
MIAHTAAVIEALSAICGRHSRRLSPPLFCFQRAFAICAFNFGAFGVQRRVRFGATLTLGVTNFVLVLLDLALSIDSAAHSRTLCSASQAVGQRRIGGLGAKLFQRLLLGLDRSALPLEKIRLLKPSSISTLVRAPRDGAD